MVNLDTQSIANEISYYGESVTVRAITDTSYSDWGDATETTSDSIKTAFVQILDQADEFVREGIFQSGDKIFWFKGDETELSRGNRIKHNGSWYEVMEVIEHLVAGNIYVVEARTRKV